MSTESHSTQKLVAFTLGGYLLGAGSLYLLKKLVCCPKKQAQCPYKKQQVVVERYGCIELGGTSIRLAIGIKETQADGTATCKFEEGSLKSIETKAPEDNIQEIKEYFENKYIDKVGIASFGPICLDETSEQYGFITSTPKQGWNNFPLLKRVGEVLPNRQVQRIGFDTDVNAAACAEFKFANHKAKQSLAYITVGTGVGVGLIVDGKCVHGLTHPEGGHLLVKPAPGEFFQGVCKFHGNCVEGMVTNHAIAQRLQLSISELSTVDDSNEIWEDVAYYLAQLCLNLTLICSPEVIVIGGGIMNRKPLLGLIRKKFIELLNLYVVHPRLSSEIEDYIVKPFFSDSGLIGSMVV